MKAFSKIIAATACVLFANASTASAQNIATPPYQGMQPELVQGVQDGMATGKPKVRHVYLAAPDIVAMTIDAHAIPILPVIDYVPQPGDVIREGWVLKIGASEQPYPNSLVLVRGGVEVGKIIGVNRDKFSPTPKIEGEPLNLDWADAPGSYSISSADDPAFASPATPSAVYRKSKPELPIAPTRSKPRHEIYLKFDRPLSPGKRYEITFNGQTDLGSKVTFDFDDTRLRSEAVAVNQVGYHPKQLEKIAFLMQWLGNGGGVDFSSQKEFRLVDDTTGRTVFTGEVTLRAAATPGKKMPAERAVDTTDALPMPVYALDFSAFSTPGRYRVAVPGIGCSFPFDINDNVWNHATTVSARGFFHQRAGIEMGPPYTTYVRPINLHPMHGFPIHQVDAARFYDPVKFARSATSSSSSWGNPFERIQFATVLDSNVTEAWGGWMDAADYDRSIAPQLHTRAVHAMLDLYESNPAYFEKLNNNIPESGNKIPDIIDEALWCMELFRRIQQPDGGVPSNVESIEHPNGPSYLLTQPTSLCPPTPQTCHLYVAAAAQMSMNLKKYDPELAEAYKVSAGRAMEWAVKNANLPNIYHRADLFPDDQHESLAYVWMYRLTQDQTWHERYKKSIATLYPSGTIRPNNGGYVGPWGHVVYAIMPPEQTDAALQAKCRAAVLAAANRKADLISSQTLHLGPTTNWCERIGEPWMLVAAHRLTGDTKYIRAMQQTAQFDLGANPTNQSYTTGLGSRVVMPYLLDPNFLGVPFPEGITTSGPLPRNHWGASKLEPMFNRMMSPAWENWPWAESNFNVRDSVSNEHMICGSLTNVLLLRGYIAQELAGRD